MTFLLIPPYFIIAFFVIRAVLKKQTTKKQKWKMGLLTAFLLYLPLGWDVILGRAVFYGLCATQGGVHVYQTVELGPEYWNEDGSPKFINSYDGEFDANVFNYKYKFVLTDKENVVKLLNITKHIDKIIDAETNDTYGERVVVVYRGGWFTKYTGFFVKGTTCGFNIGEKLYPSFLSKIFVLSDDL